MVIVQTAPFDPAELLAHFSAGRTDCGGVDAIIDWTQAALDPESGINTCSNTCIYARDGVCDDPRGANYCKIGTDCQVRIGHNGVCTGVMCVCV